MATFPFELVSPERLLFSGEVESVRLPGSEGEFEILAQHAPLLALLGPGVMEVKGGESSGQRLFIDGGFCDMNGNRCTVLAEAAIPVDSDAHGRIDELIARDQERAGDLAGDERDQMDRRLATLRDIRAAI